MMFFISVFRVPAFASFGIAATAKAALALGYVSSKANSVPSALPAGTRPYKSARWLERTSLKTRAAAKSGLSVPGNRKETKVSTYGRLLSRVKESAGTGFKFTAGWAGTGRRGIEP